MNKLINKILKILCKIGIHNDTNPFAANLYCDRCNTWYVRGWFNVKCDDYNEAGKL